jgi:photosystem II stability/assembly factor-like uncharacterized protein
MVCDGSAGLHGSIFTGIVVNSLVMGIRRALLIAVLIGTSAPALALGAPWASPSPAGLSKGADVLPQKPATDEDLGGGVGSMKLIAPGIGWAEHDVSRNSSYTFDRVYYWTSDNGKHWKNITPHAGGKQELADFFFLDTHRGWAIFDLSAEEQDHPQTRMRLTLAATTNAGATWSKTLLTLRLKDYFDDLSDLNSINVSQIAFADPLHGWLQLAYWVGTHGHCSFLLVTSDGGKTWNQADSSPGPNSPEMLLVTPDEGWIFGTVEPDGAPNSLFVTRDGTKSWRELSAQPITNLGDLKEWHEMVLQPGGVLDAEGADCEINRLPMVQDAAHAFLEEDCAVDARAGDPDSMHTTVLFATNDSGRTWKRDRTLTNFVGQCGSSTMAGSTWIAPVMKGGHVELLRVAAGATVDAGEENGSIARYSLCRTSLSFVSLTRGWMLFADKSMLRATVDGGRTWTTLTSGH